MSYTPPYSDNANFSWNSAPATEVLPLGDAANFTWCTVQLSQVSTTVTSRNFETALHVELIHPNKLDLVLKVPLPVTPELVFSDDTEGTEGIYADQLTGVAVGNVGNVDALITFSAFPITSVSAVGAVNGFTSVSQTVDLTGSQISTEQGNFTLSYFSVLNLTGVSSLSAAGSLIKSSTITKTITGVESTLNVGIVVDAFPITGNSITATPGTVTLTRTTGQIVAVGSLGNLLVTQVLTRALDGNELTGYVDEAKTSTNIPITNVVSTTIVGTIVGTITNNYASDVLGIFSAGNLTSSQALTRALDGNQINGYVSSVVAGLTVNLTSVYTNTSVGVLTQPTPVDHDYFATANVITTGIGTILAVASATRALVGNEATGVISALVITLPIYGNTAIGSANNILDAEHSFGTFAVGYTGAIQTHSDLTRNLDGNETTTIVNTVSAIKTNPLTGNSAIAQVGSVVDVHSFGVFTPGRVGSVQTQTAYNRALVGNELTGYVREFIQSYPSSITHVDAFGLVGDIIAERTADYAGSVISTLYVGSILTSNSQTKPIDSQSYRSFATVSAGNIVASQTIEIYGNSLTTDIDSVSSSITNNFPATVLSTLVQGELGLTKTGLVNLTGVQALGYTGFSYSTKIFQLTSAQITTRLGQATARSSIGVKAILSVGSITSTYQDCFQNLFGNTTTISEGILRSYKYSALIGVVGNLTPNSFADVTHSLGVRSIGQVNSMGVQMTIDTYPTGVQGTFNTGNVFATQTVDLTGVVGNLTPNNFADVTHSLGVQSITSVGSLKYKRAFNIFGSAAICSIGTLGVKTAFTRNLIGNKTLATIYKNLGPTDVYLNEHHEVEIPKTYSLEIEGDFSSIQSFECINCQSPLIELYHRDSRAWIRLNTPGSFEDSRLYYVDMKGNYDFSFTWDTIPEEAMVYKIEANKVLQLVFLMKATYDDGGPKIPITRKYYVDIVVDHSFDRDTLGTTEVV